MNWDYASALTWNLINSPVQALSQWPSWVGFAGVEWISDFAQNATDNLLGGFTDNDLGGLSSLRLTELGKIFIRAGATDLRFEFASLRGYL
jgi:hypothetical protein